MKYFYNLSLILISLTVNISYADQNYSYEKEIMLKYKSSFDCSKASTEVEKQICANKTLSQLDGLLASTYKNRQSPNFGLDLKRFRQDQLSWLKDRNKCQDANCIQKKYHERLLDICDIPTIKGVKFEEDCDIFEKN
jgi:uncharacterized protein